ncbi:ferredoxin [Frankia sp. EAN1pec]|uniref:ferredoxin n=1 Tax=Parafrankia sp. (strain EAN1pec) TaxID=298653 RepID=UPI0002D9C88A
MRIVAEREMCSGHTRCAAVLPGVFALDDDGYLNIDSVDIPAGSEQLARDAIAACPERVLRETP